MPPYVDATEQLVTEIFVRDAQRSAEFYCRLGFQLLRDDGTFVVLGWEGHQLFFAQLEEKQAQPDYGPANIRVLVPNVEHYWKLAGEMDARVVIPIGERSYGLRDFTIADPDGFCVRFGTRLSA